jgi:uncharacterized protein YjbJ (UPF0337 family)
LTEGQIKIVAGKREQLTGKIQEVYGISNDEAN